MNRSNLSGKKSAFCFKRALPCKANGNVLIHIILVFPFPIFTVFINMPTPSLYDSAFESIRSMWIRSVMFVTQPVFQRLLPDPYTEAGNVRVDKKPAHVSRVTMTEIISPAQCNMLVNNDIK